MADKDQRAFRPAVGVIKGRGATTSPDARYMAWQREDFDDGWTQEEALAPLATTLSVDASRSVISYNQSPDVPFDRSVNPYRGCEHGCVYCFARPTHAYLDLSPGLDFETKLFYKPNAVVLLQQELAAKSYRCAPIAVGINTDAYQPIERQLKLTRAILEVLIAQRHPFTIVTKSALIERDMDLLVLAAQQNLVSVAVSLTTLQRDVARRMEPRAAAPQRRLATIKALAAAGVPVLVLVAPVIPVLTEHELENLLAAARDAGAYDAGYALLRLPHENKVLFEDWLQTHVPLQASHVLSRVQQMRDGKLYDAEFGARMRGTGVFAELLAKRFDLAYQRLGFASMPKLDCSQFLPPSLGGQLSLF